MSGEREDCESMSIWVFGLLHIKLRSRGSQFTHEKQIKQIGRKVETKEAERGRGSFPGPVTSVLWMPNYLLVLGLSETA